MAFNLSIASFASVLSVMALKRSAAEAEAYSSFNLVSSS